MTKRRKRRHHEIEEFDPPVRTLEAEPDAAGATNEHNVLQMQRQYGNAYVQRKLGSKADAAANEDRLIQLVIDGVMAFEELADYWPVVGGETEPDVPGGTPDGLRPAMFNLLKAKIFRFGIGLPDVQEVVQQRLAPEGVIGFGKLVLFGPKYEKQTQLDRQLTAKTSWQMARPIFSALISRYEGLNGANADYAARLRQMMTKMDYEVTTLIPRLTMELEAMMTPEESRRMKAVAEAKQAMSVMGKIIDGVKTFDQAKDLKGKMDKFMGDGGGPMGESIESPEPTPSAINQKKFNDDDVIEFSEGASVGGGGGKSKFEQGVAAYDALKTMVELYNSPDGIAESIGKIAKAESSGMGLLEIQKSTFDIANALTSQVKSAGKLLIEGAAEMYDLRYKLLAKMYPNDIGRLASGTSLIQRANSLRQFAEKLEGLEKFTGVLELLTGAMSLVQGVEGNDFEAIAGGAIGLTEGAVSMLAPTMAVPLMPWMASAKAMVHVVAQTSRMLQNIQNAQMKKSLQGMEEELNVAALNAHLYEMAMTEWFMRYNSPDPVEKALGEQYADKAQEKAAIIQKALWEAFSRVTQGTISKFPILADTFDMAFGGHDLVMDTWRQLQNKKIDSSGDLLTHAEFLGEVVMKLSNAMSDLEITMKALEDDVAGKVGVTGSDRNALTFKNKILLAAGGWTIEQSSDDIEFDGPIDNQEYKDWLAAKLHGKSLGEIHGMVLNIEAEVLGETISMAGSDGDLFSSSTMSDKVLKALAQALLGKDPSDDSVTSDQVTRALWKLCLRNLHMPDGKYFK